MEIDCIEPDYYYHIYNRGINKQPIFSKVPHYYKFLDFCEKYIISYADILAYCLIPNHFHFLVYIHPDAEINTTKKVSRHFADWFNAYAQYFNSSTCRTGSLFQRPFKRKRITDQEYLRNAIYYIHRNPLHHSLTKLPSDYKFSSYRTILTSSSTFIDRNQVLELFEGSKNFEDFHRAKFDLDAAQFFDD